jgi:predicted kinase
MAGRLVIIDLVFAQAEERTVIRNVAANTGVKFDGIWQVAEPAIAEQRKSPTGA